MSDIKDLRPLARIEDDTAPKEATFKADLQEPDVLNIQFTVGQHEEWLSLSIPSVESVGAIAQSKSCLMRIGMTSGAVHRFEFPTTSAARSAVATVLRLRDTYFRLSSA